MNWLSQFAKYVILILNLLTATCAMMLIIFGLIYFMNENYGVNVFSDIGSFFSFGIIAIALGVIMLFISAFGCFGALHQNTCLLTIYGVILIILFGIELAIGILAVIKIIDEDDFYNFVKDLIQDLFTSGYVQGDPGFLKSFYNLQKEFDCCGVNSIADYDALDIGGYPASCCEKGSSPCFHPFEIGCAEAFTEAIRGYIQIIGYVAIGFAAVELIGAIFAFMVRRNNKQNELKIGRSSKAEETSI